MDIQQAFDRQTDQINELILGINKLIRRVNTLEQRVEKQHQTIKALSDYTKLISDIQDDLHCGTKARLAREAAEASGEPTLETLDDFLSQVLGVRMVKEPERAEEPAEDEDDTPDLPF